MRRGCMASRGAVAASPANLQMEVLGVLRHLMHLLGDGLDGVVLSWDWDRDWPRLQFQVQQLVDLEGFLPEKMQAGVELQRIGTQLEKIVGEFQERLIELNRFRVAQLQEIVADLEKVAAQGVQILTDFLRGFTVLDGDMSRSSRRTVR